MAETLPKVNRDLRKQFVSPPEIKGEFEENTPADVIFWDDAVEFCERLTGHTGIRYRLPSEAEWEYACRAGTTTEYSFGEVVRYDLAHFKELGSPAFYLALVGSKGYTNAWGLYDTHGNVAELCADVEHPNYIGAPTDGSVWTQGGKQRGRILRGGMYALREEFGRSSSRYFWDQFLAVSGVGFRVVAEIPFTAGNGIVVATSAASYTNTMLAPETISSLFGTNLSATTQTASTLPLPNSLASASITLKDSRGNEHLASLFFASPSQINFLLPASLSLGPATIYAVNNGNIHSSGTLEITNVSAGLFSADASGKGLATAVGLRVKADGTQVYEPVARFDPAQNRFVAQPIDLSNPNEQVFLLLFGTGWRGRSSLASVAATVGGTPVEVLFAGAQGELAGLDQANLRLPASLAGRGAVNVTLTVDGRTSNAVSVEIK